MPIRRNNFKERKSRMVLLLGLAIICAIFKIYWGVTVIAIIWTAFYIIAFLKGVINFFNPGISRMGTLICGVKAVVGIYILIWAFT